MIRLGFGGRFSYNFELTREDNTILGSATLHLKIIQ